MGDIS